MPGAQWEVFLHRTESLNGVETKNTLQLDPSPTVQKRRSNNEGVLDKDDNYEGGEKRVGSTGSTKRLLMQPVREKIALHGIHWNST